MKGIGSMMKFLFSAKGRVSRKTFWLKFVLPMIGVYIVIYAIMGALMFSFMGSDTLTDPNAMMTSPAYLIMNLAYFPIGILIMWVSVCICAKRFHDRNMSGWWYLWFMLIFIGLYAVMLAGVMPAAMNGSTPGMLALVASLVGGVGVLIAWIAEFVILGFLPGTKGPNRYGPDPLDPNSLASAEDVFG